MQYLMIEGRREGYGPDQLRKTMTIGELTDYLSQFDEETPVILNNDNGYTYGSITRDSFMDGNFDEDGNRMDEEEDE